MVVEYSEASMGVVPPPGVPLAFKEPSALTMTQLLPVAPGVVVKVKPVKLAEFVIALLDSPETVPAPPIVKPIPVRMGFTLLL